MKLNKLIMTAVIIPLTATALELSVASEIQVLHSFTNLGNADVAFALNTTSGVCKGYWFNKDDAGYQSNLSMLIAAYQANTKVLIYGHEEASAKWTQTEAHYCKLYGVTYSR